MSDGGKGSAPRPYSVDHNTFANNWELAFGKKKKQEKEINESALRDEFFDLQGYTEGSVKDSEQGG